MLDHTTSPIARSRSIRRAESKDPQPRRPASSQTGLSLLESLIAAAIVGVAVAATLTAWQAQVRLNEHARNVVLAMNDGNRIMEELRFRNTEPCVAGTSPTVTAPASFAAWDDWLADTTSAGGGGKSLQALPGSNEVVSVVSTGADPIQVTIAVCWTHRERAVGDCDATDGIIRSPAMLFTSVTCRRS